MVYAAKFPNFKITFRHQSRLIKTSGMEKSKNSKKKTDIYREFPIFWYCYDAQLNFTHIFLTTCITIYFQKISLDHLKIALFGRLQKVQTSDS